MMSLVLIETYHNFEISLYRALTLCMRGAVLGKGSKIFTLSDQDTHRNTCAEKQTFSILYSPGKRVEWPPNQDEDQLVTVQVTTKSKTYSTQMDQQQEQQQHASTIVKNHFPAANNSMQKVNGVKHEFENNGGEQQRGEAANNIAGFGKGRFVIF